MKKFGTFFTSLMLALAIIYIGAGMIVIECQMNHTISVIDIGEISCKVYHIGNHHAQGCMKIKFMKLQPTVIAKQFVHTELPMLAIRSFLYRWSVNEFAGGKELCNMHRVMHSPHAPPRFYLTIIRVLII